MPFKQFVERFSELIWTSPKEDKIATKGAALLGELVATSDWLEAKFTVADAERYQQYLLHLDPHGAFSVVSSVWAPGQGTPVHDHKMWGLVGTIVGAERTQNYRLGKSGQLEIHGDEVIMRPGDVQFFSPMGGDIHQVRNFYDDRVSVSIHVYGGDIGNVRRTVFLPDGGQKPFVSGYSKVSR